MKYYKSNKFIKSIGSTGIVSLTACVLIAIGAIAWFALSNNNKVTTEPESYVKENSSYNEVIPSEVTPSESTPPATDANETVSEVPYKEEVISSNPQPKPEPIKYVMPINGNISKGYSDTALQYSATYNDMRLHTGVDILCETGSKIKSAGSGTVKSIINDANYGKIIVINHTSELTVKYCGFSEVKVKEGDNVKSGDIIGLSGEIPCECADKPHIHIEAAMQNKTISPLEAMGLK